MPPVSLHLLGPAPKPPVPSLEAVGRWANIEELSRSGIGGDEIVVLAAPGLARGEKGADGLTKWGMISTAELEGLTPEAARLSVEREAERHRLERENARLRGDLLTVGRKIAHDLRSPLGGILSTAELLREILGDHSAEDAALTGPVFASVKSLSSVVDCMSLIARATARGAARDSVRMEQPLAMAFQRLDRRLAERGARVEVEPGTAGLITGDGAMLEEIWFQLLENAVTHGGSRIRAGREGEWWFVEDDGPGVPTERLDSLFQPFHTLHHPGSARGLGLSVVERLVVLHGGECAHAAPSGGGARFSFLVGG